MFSIDVSRAVVKSLKIRSLLGENIIVTLELKPEVEARAIEQAAAYGIPVEAFLESVIEDSLNGREEKPFYETATAGEWEAALDEFGDSPAFSRAVSFVDDSRESIYREREDSQL